jgi:hypothetical protein
MRRAQLVSMDFIIAFVVFIFALSFFFSIMKSTLSYENISLTAPAELIFSRMEQNYDEELDFLDGPIIDKDKFERYILQNDANEIYSFIFRDFDNPSSFRKMEYCVFIENKTPEKREILRNFAAYSGDDYFISIGNDLCGTNPNRRYTNVLPHCDFGEEALLLSKPVLYNKDIMNLRILVCAKKR